MYADIEKERLSAVAGDRGSSFAGVRGFSDGGGGGPKGYPAASPLTGGDPGELVLRPPRRAGHLLREKTSGQAADRDPRRGEGAPGRRRAEKLLALQPPAGAGGPYADAELSKRRKLSDRRAAQKAEAGADAEAPARHRVGGRPRAAAAPAPFPRVRRRASGP